jgi:hypothetical protein
MPKLILANGTNVYYLLVKFLTQQCSVMMVKEISQDELTENIIQLKHRIWEE